MRNGPAITDGADAVLINHWMVRDGSFWACRNDCGTQVPFPSPMPDSATLGQCVPRRWGDGVTLVDGRAAETPARAGRLPAVYDPVRGGPSALDHACPKCAAPAGSRCRDGRRRNAMPTLRPHEERR